MKIFFFTLLFLGFWGIAKADHITGGEMYYRATSTSNGQYQYVFTVKLFKDCHSSRQLLDPSIISVFDRLTGDRMQDITVPLAQRQTISLTNPNKCITNPPDVCYEIGYYEFAISLPATRNGYVVTCQVSFRVQGIKNLVSYYNSVSATYTAEIPGGANANNQSAQFVGSDLVAVCANNSFTYSFAAQDDDGDELRYSFCDAWQGGSGGGRMAVPPAPPPYPVVPYGPGFDGGAPLGTHVGIDNRTGLIKGIAPGEGYYVVTVCVQEVRNGVVIATQRKDLQINIASCTIAAASLLPEYMLCKNTNTLTISNNSNSPLIKTYNWDLLNENGQVMSTQSTPGFTYSFIDTGVYKIKLTINKDLECGDSIQSEVKVYPGLKTDFDFAGICFKKPTQFNNKSSTVYGAINSFVWDFGEPYNSENQSTLPNPSFQYSALGSKNAQLMVQTTKGCRDTVIKIVSIIEKPKLDLAFRDTLICVNDKVQLLAQGQGLFNWFPAATLSNSTSSTPIANPITKTTYFVTLDDNGCINRDSVNVGVVNSVSLKMMNDTTICQGDSVRLKISSDAFTYAWQPASQMVDASVQNPVVFTNATTAYTVVARIGGCVAKNQVIVAVVPYPKAFAGADTTICNNTAVQLTGSGNGSAVIWSPASSLNHANQLSPLAQPKSTTAYTLSVFDNKGCPKPGRDTVVVTVLPPIRPFAGNDTSVVLGQPLQLNATGGVRYKWTPSLGLSADSIANPVAVFNTPYDDVLYRVDVFNEVGCVAASTVQVKIFSTGPTVFVPTAFTPNGDGKNDRINPVAVGMKKIEFFSIYNRWGQLVYSMPLNGIGWDGTIGGKVQHSETFIWMVKAIDYNNKYYFRKGTLTLIQ